MSTTSAGTHKAAMTCKARLTGCWLSIADVFVGPSVQTTARQARAPHVLRLIEGSLCFCQHTAQHIQQHHLRPGDILTIPAGSRFSWSNKSEQRAWFSLTVETDELQQEWLTETGHARSLAA